MKERENNLTRIPRPPNRGKAQVRGNVFRHSNNSLADYSIFYGLAKIRVHSVERMLCEKNLVDLENPHALEYVESTEVKCFANTASGGRPILGYNDTVHRYDDELRTRIEDALLLAL